MKTNRLWFSRTFACLILAAAGHRKFVYWPVSVRSRGLAFNTLKLIGGTLAISLPLGALLGILDCPHRSAAAPIGRGHDRRLADRSLVSSGCRLAIRLRPLRLVHARLRRRQRSLALEMARGNFRSRNGGGAMGRAFCGVCCATGRAAVGGSRCCCDAPAWRVFCHVTLRRIWPAFGLASIWVALLVATDMTVTDLYQVRTYAEEVYVDFAAPTDIHAAPLGPWTGALVVTALTAGAILLARRGATLGPTLAAQADRLRARQGAMARDGDHWMRAFRPFRCADRQSHL